MLFHLLISKVKVEVHIWVVIIQRFYETNTKIEKRIDWIILMGVWILKLISLIYYQREIAYS